MLNSRAQTVCHLFQRFQFSLVHQLKLYDEIVEMFVTLIHVSFQSHLSHLIEMVDVHVNKYTMQTFEQNFYRIVEVLRKWDIGALWENVFVVDFLVDPIQ